ncbi:hypothetical protein DH2020_045896 [Rehmannia glutinosa]|uniref:Aminotransferase-like plant mobile domain-containing protein n=1 Tax=Rehmannia glutinosa TaxID=99300 RepID=A0ABR0UCU5_REHGL
MNEISIDHRNMCKNMIARLLVGSVQCDPGCAVKHAQQQVKEKYGWEISYHKAWHGLKRARENVYGTWESSVRMLPKYMGALHKWNPGTVVEWVHREVDVRGIRTLFYMFWAFKPCVEGPRRRDVLTQQYTHRSQDVLAGAVDVTLSKKSGASAFWKLVQTRGLHHPRVVYYLHVMGLHGVYSCRSIKVDNHWITALVERWCPETHTIHFPFGEATITLQDVACIWGLPIDGYPVTGLDPDLKGEELQDYCYQLLGFRR